jgi:hypothetical protein
MLIRSISKMLKEGVAFDAGAPTPAVAAVH